MNIRVLCVEDDEVDRMALERKVRGAGLPYDLEIAGSIGKALELLEKKSYDVVLLDYILPDGTGLELLKKIRDIPVIFITGSVDVKVAVQALKEGAYDYLMKDPDRSYLEVLPATVDKVIKMFLLELEHKKDEEQMAIMNSELSRMYEEVKSLSLHDPLTGLANRRMMEIDLERSIAEVNRYGINLSVLMMDIDYFKKYNDTHGHPAGDRLLSEIGKVLAEEVREVDLVARYGGEEFIVVLPDTGLNGALITAERIRRAVSEGLGVTVSIGAAEYHKEQKMEELIGRADAALYQAKEK